MSTPVNYHLFIERKKGQSETSKKDQTSSLAGIKEQFFTYESKRHIAFLLMKSEDWLIYFVYQHFLDLPPYSFCKYIRRMSELVLKL